MASERIKEVLVLSRYTNFGVFSAEGLVCKGKGAVEESASEGRDCFGRYRDLAMTSAVLTHFHCEESATANDAAISAKNRDTKLVLSWSM